MTASPDHGDTGTALIAAEIRALRKGRGIAASDLDSRLGPRLRELTGDVPDGDTAQVRRALAGELIRHAERLPGELRTAIMAALGLSAPTRAMPFFGDRVSWLAEQLCRDTRTALRRVDDAEQLLDGETPEALERRRIVATRPGVDEITVSLDVPRDDGQQRMSLNATVTAGGELVRADEPSRSRTQWLIRLPEPLQPGQAHEYEIRVRVPSGERMRPYYVFTPERRCDSFDLRVRFDRRRLPGWVRRVDGEPVRVFEEIRPAGELVAIDGTGEACASFGGPVMHLGYGLQWEP